MSSEQVDGYDAGVLPEPSQFVDVWHQLRCQVHAYGDPRCALAGGCIRGGSPERGLDNAIASYGLCAVMLEVVR